MSLLGGDASWIALWVKARTSNLLLGRVGRRLLNCEFGPNKLGLVVSWCWWALGFDRGPKLWVADTLRGYGLCTLLGCQHLCPVCINWLLRLWVGHDMNPSPVDFIFFIRLTRSSTKFFSLLLKRIFDIPICIFHLL